MKAALVQDIVQVLEQGMLMLGIKGQNLPSQIEFQMFVTELKKEYQGLKIGELLLAFQLSSRNKLDFHIETYQMFSVLYLNRMISAYHRWAIHQRQNIKPVYEEKQITYTMPDNEVVDIAFESYTKLRDWRTIVMWDKAFNILHKSGEIKLDNVDYVVNLTIQALKSQVRNRLEKKHCEQLINNEDELERLCRKMALSLYFENQLKK